MVLGDVGTYNIFVRDYTIIQLSTPIQTTPLYQCPGAAPARTAP